MLAQGVGSSLSGPIVSEVTALLFGLRERPTWEFEVITVCG
jgi:hypothetical protein